MHHFLPTCQMGCYLIHKSLDKADQIFKFIQVNFVSLTTRNYIYQKICKLSPHETINVSLDWKTQHVKRSGLLKFIHRLNAIPGKRSAGHSGVHQPGHSKFYGNANGQKISKGNNKLEKYTLLIINAYQKIIGMKIIEYRYKMRLQIKPANKHRSN